MAFGQCRSGAFRQIPVRTQVEIEIVIPVGLIAINPFEDIFTGIRNHDVDATALLFNIFYKAFDLGGLGDIDRRIEKKLWVIGQQSLGLRCILQAGTSASHHGIAVREKGFGDGPSYTLAGTGNYRYTFGFVG